MIIPTYTDNQMYDHILTHGAGIFQDLADDDILLHIRDYILWRNTKISISENIPVIGIQNRFSYGWDVNEESLLSEILQQITTRNPQLQRALEGLLGPNPAVVEISTITVLEGAAAQHFHHDLKYLHSAPLFGRTYQHMYSLLIPLQDTTSEMGSTWVAPGSHYCANTEFDAAFPVAGNAVWKKGNGLLYHSSVVHRGGAHVAGPERVALILSFTSRPDASHYHDLSTQYSRLLSRGPVFAIRYNHWGFTFNDLKRSNETMQMPHLRSFGLYKKPEEEWGWTYVRSLAFRMMHDLPGFKFMDLEAFVKARLGIFKYIPTFLLGPVEDRGDDDDYAPWPRFLSGTLRNVRNTAAIFLLGVIGVAIAPFLPSLLTRPDNFSGSVKITMMKEQRIAARISLGIALAISLLGYISWRRIQSTPFARSLDTDTVISVPFQIQEVTEPVERQEYFNTIVAPCSYDVFVSNRLHHDKLYNQCRWLDFHGANRKFLLRILMYKDAWMSYRGTGDGFRRDFLFHVTREGLRDDDSGGKIHRILKQNQFGDWIQARAEESIQYTQDLLVRLWSTQYDLVKFGGAFWTGPCACRYTQTLCSGLLGSRFFSVDTPLSHRTEIRQRWPAKLIVQMTKRARSDGTSMRSTSTAMTTFSVGELVEVHMSYLNSRKWFLGRILRIDNLSQTATIRFLIPVNDEVHPIQDLRKQQPNTMSVIMLPAVIDRPRSRLRSIISII
jgi:hypothetical protein